MHALRCASGQLAGHSGRGWPAAQLPRKSGCQDVGASAAPRASRAAWSQRGAPGRRRVLLCAAAAKTYYEVLGVTQSASGKDIKSAYRKAALKLHPDVNKAPDAKDRFQEAKAAFETLSDANMRAEYDRRLRVGDASSWAGGRSGFGSSGFGGYSGSGGYGQRKPKPEDDYSFDDFLKDLDKEFSGWASERSSKRKGAAPKSLWEELEGIGEEFVDFLEEELGLPKEEEKKASSSSSSSSSKGNSYGDYTSEDWYKKYEAQAGPASQPPPRPPPAQPKKSADDDIDDMLAALKKKHGRA